MTTSKKIQRANERQVGGSHYKEMGVEPWDVVDTWPFWEKVGYYRGNAIKYLMRMGAKGAKKIEAEKAHHYTQKLIEVLNEGPDKT